MKNRAFGLALLFLGFVATTGETCGPSLNTDAGFDFWCGETLCAWSVEEGAVERVPTWHRKDFGVSLEGDRVTLAQLVDSKSVRCLEVSLQADRDDEVALSLDLDFEDDGVVDYTRAVSADDWEREVVLVTPPEWYATVRVRVRKEGAGRAVLARIRLDEGEGCDGVPVAVIHRPLGAPCERGDQCAGGRCATVRQWLGDADSGTRDVCVACDDASCPGAVCGLVWGTKDALALDCVPADTRSLGERCAVDGECASGICCDGVCSECCGDRGCDGAAACALRAWETVGKDYEAQMFPHQCGPADGAGVADSPCLRDDDCASGECQGDPLSICFVDGWTCEDDTVCPWGEGACLPLGVRDGRCR